MNTTDAAAIIEALKAEANKTLSAALGAKPLQAFDITSNGNFPYIWQNPNTLTFNNKTYSWISGNLKATKTPVEFDPGSNFVTQYLGAITKVRYSLSSTDQSKLNTFAARATQQQAALLNAWVSAGNTLPTGNTPIIDITQTILSWSSSNVSLQDVQSSINPSSLFNKMPGNGGAILKVFFNWVAAMGDGVALQNNITQNNAYLDQAIAALQYPSDANGGIAVDNNAIKPAYKVANQVADIQNQLQNQGSKVTLSMSASRANTSEFDVSVSGSAGIRIPVLSFLTVGVSGNTNYFASDMAVSTSSTSVKMTFPGVNLVNFGPTSFDASGKSNSWFWMSPIQDAIRNGYPAKDVSGFKFEVQPSITDWSTSGSFGYLQGVAISSYPTIEITVTSSDYQKIQQTFQQSVTSSVSFLGIPLASATESTYSNSVKVDASTQTVTITLTPPQSLIAGNLVDSLGWILGVQTQYPAA